MLSNKWAIYQTIIALCVISLFTMSCNLKIGESMSSTDQEEQLFGCLNAINKKVENYLRGNMVQQSVNQVSTCVKNALNMFKGYVRGKKKGEFTPDEFRKFIQDLFLHDRVISDNLLHQMAVLKTVIIGGPADKLTISDIDRFTVFIDIIKKEMLFLQPHFQFFYYSSGVSYLSKQNRFNQITHDLEQSIARISQFLNTFSNPYHFSDMKVFIEEVDFFLTHDHNISNLDQKIKTASVMKQFVVGGELDKIQPKEWEDLLLGFSHLVATSVNYLLLQKQKSFTSLRSMQLIPLIVESIIKFIEISIKSHPQEIIKEQNMVQLISSLQTANILSRPLRKISIQNLLKIFLVKVFKQNHHQSKQANLSKSQLYKIKEFIYNWLNTQSIFNNLIHQNPLLDGHITANKVTSLLPAEGPLLNNRDHILQIFSLKPLHLGSGKIQLSRSMYNPKKRKQYNYTNLTFNHFYLLLAEMIRMGYQASYPKAKGMKKLELQNLFLDINPIAQDLQWFPKSQDRDWYNNGSFDFSAANMVTPSGTGYHPQWNVQELLINREIVEYISYSISIEQTLQIIEPVLFAKCGKHDDEVKSIYDGRYDMECIYYNFLPILQKHIQNMPDLVRYLRTQNQKKKLSYTEALLEISFYTKAEYRKARYLDRGNLKRILLAVYFGETTFNRYDSNSDGALQHEEVVVAYHAFEGYINRAIVRTLGTDFLFLSPSVYAYVVHKKVPIPPWRNWKDLSDILGPYSQIFSQVASEWWSDWTSQWFEETPDPSKKKNNTSHGRSFSDRNKRKHHLQNSHDSRAELLEKQTRLQPISEYNPDDEGYWSLALDREGIIRVFSAGVKSLY